MIRRLSDRASARGLLVLIAAAGLMAGAVALPAAGVPAAPTRTANGPGNVHVSFTGVASGLNEPVQLVSARDGTKRLYVVDRDGAVRVVTDGHLHSRVYLDLRGRTTTDGERGLLSIAFHPNFNKHHFVYAAYTHPDGDLQVSRFRASSTTARHVSLSTERRTIRVRHRQAGNHNGGQLLFGTHRRLFITTGDGGGQGDQYGHAEDLTSLSSKILRLDVMHSCGSHHYCIPDSNPFAGASNAHKRAVFDWGLRNPWRASIDPRDDTLWIGDVGQDTWEEVDHVKQVGGKDFGWSCMEGDHSFNTGNCRIAGHARRLTRPVHEYSHANSRCAIIGGAVYRGPRYPFAHGIYVYADYCGGQVYGLKHTASGWHNAQIGSISSPIGFGVSDSGELYITTQNGQVKHVVFHRG